MSHIKLTSTSNDTASDCPFRTRLFGSSQAQLQQQEQQHFPQSASVPNTEPVSKTPSWEHYPVSFRTGEQDEHISAVNYETFAEFLTTEFSLRRLDDIYEKLWRVGFVRPTRPLNTHTQLGREIVLTNTLDMHLVWTKGKIYLKPLPRYLLEPEFWSRDISAAKQVSGSVTAPDKLVSCPATGVEIPQALAVGSSSDIHQLNASQSPSLADVRRSALGLLYTYACLITHPNELKMALDLGLVPMDGERAPDWTTWRLLATEILQDSNIRDKVHRRFHHSELRLDRLNWIYIFRDMPSFRMYHNQWYNYTDFFVANLTWVTASTVYIAIVLTAMQLGLATNALKNDKTFHRASYGFTVFSILSPIVAVSFVSLALLVALIPNWITARSAKRKSAATQEDPIDARNEQTAGQQDGAKRTTGLFARRRREEDAETPAVGSST